MHFQFFGAKDTVNILFAAPFEPGLLRCILYLVLEGGHKSTKVGLAMGVKIGDDAEKVAITLIC